MSTPDQTLQILDHLVSQLSKTLGDMNRRISDLEKSEGLAVLESIDWERQYPDGTLGRHKNGLFRYSLADGQWHVLANAINSVEAVDGKFRFERSTGEFFDVPITPAKPRQKALAA